jgi:hypothetical protein
MDTMFVSLHVSTMIIHLIISDIEFVWHGFNYSYCVTDGQTGSGKTHTMEGTNSDPGVAPRAVSELFRLIDELSSDWVYTVTFSMLEIYNESIFDLLLTDSNGSASNTNNNNGREREKLDIRQTNEGNIVPGLTEHMVRLHLT